MFPYLYIPFDGSQDAGALMHQIAASIDKAVNISLNQASSTNQHVYKISLVSGMWVTFLCSVLVQLEPEIGLHNLRTRNMFNMFK